MRRAFRFGHVPIMRAGRTVSVKTPPPAFLIAASDGLGSVVKPDGSMPGTHPHESFK